MNEVGKWLAKAKYDLETARINLDNDRYDAASFFAHQAAEKALKALYVMKTGRLWKIHDLTELGRKVGAPLKILRHCDALNPHYIETRYPMEAEYDDEIAEEAIEKAEEVVKWATNVLTARKS